ncbi:hypothetical protein KG091_06765 [Carnobacteriaceae bacterium zg-ZUI78]|uniref:hypothetical protein n=1 Tax=Granulicatella sp. zg-84 TaxID=2678503 RepID=UPI0013BEF893|nr:hypothetical protein [Granulicatella sp. zg-84]MBS4750776.1 hypothetical protein [Carnobacteriaceae bacterium zg-ZUI78]NEW66494.1 hypothetical protein [Granulicatella sp. zg-84]QMI85516.1 hypothetical protein H1220_07300 [Carnobacteriaceae bacterium zg-84]
MLNFFLLLVGAMILGSLTSPDKKKRGRHVKRQDWEVTHKITNQLKKTYRELNEEFQKTKVVVHQPNQTILQEDVEDEESYETELTTPMSMEVDDGEVYTDREWEVLSHTEVSTPKPVKKKALTPLQKALIYTEILGKPKGLDD